MKTLKDVVKNPSGWDSFANYIGPTEFGEFDCLLTQNRDSDVLQRSNFKSALKKLGGEGDNVEIHRFGHWACGWWEVLAVKRGTPQHAIALQIEEKMEDYPVVDDEDFSREEQDEAELVWRDCYSDRDRIEYIREHRSQFDFHSFADLLGCVRGRYFAGYASELIQ